MPDCEAEERNMRALYEIELMWGSGVTDLGKLKHILTSRDTPKCAGQDTTRLGNTRQLSVKLGS
jgi:hypothetical protein